MVAHTQTHPHPQHHGHHRPAPLDRHFLGVSWRYWVISGIVLGACLSIYEANHALTTPNAFDQPGAQSPNKLRSPWGVEKPL
jgi:hypothetical protein